MHRHLGKQLLILSAVVIFSAYLIKNAAVNLTEQGIASGFSFLHHKTGFDIIMHIIPYDESSTYFCAFLVGLLNTLILSFVGIICCTIIGFIIAIGRISNNWIISKISLIYIEVFRNIPLLLQIFFWYFAILRNLPSPKESYSFFEIAFLNIRGLYLPNPITWEVPKLTGFNFTGGIVVIPELFAMLIGLSLYTASYVAEIIRAGIVGIDNGQREASFTLGLNRWQTLRLVIIPQALRIIIPPLTSQYLNLTKNSSLAAAIAYPDLVSVFAGTVLNQTGQAVEVILITMAVYLSISLSISALMNLYNRKTILVER